MTVIREPTPTARAASQWASSCAAARTYMIAVSAARLRTGVSRKKMSDERGSSAGRSAKSTTTPSAQAEYAAHAGTENAARSQVEAARAATASAGGSPT